MVGFADAIMGFFSPEAGQARRAWLTDKENSLKYYLGPGFAPFAENLANTATALSPVDDYLYSRQGVDRFLSSSGGINKGLGLAEAMAGAAMFAAPAAGAMMFPQATRQAVESTARVADDVAQPIAEAAERFYVDESGSIGSRFTPEQIRLIHEGAFLNGGDDAVSDVVNVLPEVAARGDEALRIYNANPADWTDELLDMGDPVLNTQLNQYLWANSPVPMDEAARLGRGEDMGFMDNWESYHSTDADVREFNPSFRSREDGSTYRVGVYSADRPKVSETYASPIGGNTMPLATKGTFDDVAVDAGGANWNQITPESRVIRNGEDVGSIREIFPDSIEETTINGEKMMTVRTNTLAREAMHDGAGSLKIDNVIDLGGYYSPNTSLQELGAADIRTDFYPHNIRSRFARFWPGTEHLKNLSAGIAATPLAYYMAGGDQAQAATLPQGAFSVMMRPNMGVDELARYIAAIQGQQ